MTGFFRTEDILDPLELEAKLGDFQQPLAQALLPALLPFHVGDLKKPYRLISKLRSNTRGGQLFVPENWCYSALKT